MKIMVGIDGSETAEAAAGYVKQLVSNQLKDAAHSVVLVYVIRPPSGSTGPGFAFRPFANTDIYRVFREEAEAVLEDAADAFADLELAVKMIHEVGEPAQVLARLATEEEVDLLVVGSRGTGGLRGLTLGSVSQRVTQIAPCPVLVVRGKKEVQELRRAALQPTREEEEVEGEPPRDRTREGRIERRPRCSRCGVLLTAENMSQKTGYCDPCRSVVEGEIRRRRGFGSDD